MVVNDDNNSIDYGVFILGLVLCWMFIFILVYFYGSFVGWRYYLYFREEGIGVL